MKNILILLWIVILSFGCKESKEKKVKELLNDPAIENEIFSNILTNKAHLSNFMDEMMRDENCKRMMITSKPMIKMMCQSYNMDTLMMFDNGLTEQMTGKIIKTMLADSMVCDQVCTRIMANEQLNHIFSSRANKRNNKPFDSGTKK